MLEGGRVLINWAASDTNQLFTISLSLSRTSKKIHQCHILLILPRKQLFLYTFSNSSPTQGMRISVPCIQCSYFSAMICQSILPTPAFVCVFSDILGRIWCKPGNFTCLTLHIPSLQISRVQQHNHFCLCLLICGDRDSPILLISQTLGFTLLAYDSLFWQR